MSHPPTAAQSALPPAAGDPPHASDIQDRASRIQKAGLYVHIPFCLRKCRYCGFASGEDLSLQHRYAAAVCREMAMVERAAFPAFDTLYIGGGTPTVIEEHLLLRILETALAGFAFTDAPEVTVEANPGTVSLDRLMNLRKAGVNRINLGIQSFADENLAFLGRIHTARLGAESIGHARSAGFANVGIDLIYGLPGQGTAAWIAELEKAVSFSPEHLSCYMLTFETGTPLERDLAAGRIETPEEKTVAELFSTTSEILRSRGYLHYEISNFARSARFCSRHNQKYWHLAPILGLGPSAHSYLPAPPVRWWNLARTADYVTALEEGRLPVQEKENLTVEQCLTEALFLSLRTAAGIDPDGFVRRFGFSLEERFGGVLAELKTGGMLKLKDGRWSPTLRGMQFADTVAARFVERI
ncbi:MAG: radical SAM family heme chaperone HemW [Desulfobacterales bacterium]|jgi:oxygen-independent coproporphyrinogen-3 oxidase